jgi:hypothetical protein
LALLGRLPSAHVDGHVMQASEKPAQHLPFRGAWVSGSFAPKPVIPASGNERQGSTQAV